MELLNLVKIASGNGLLPRGQPTLAKHESISVVTWCYFHNMQKMSISKLCINYTFEIT